MKSAHKGTITEFVKDNKPLGSTHPRDWLKSGGSLTIDTFDDGTQVWKYTKDGISVPYVPRMVNGEMQNVVQFPKSTHFPRKGVGEFILNQGFTGDRKKDKQNALEYLSENFDIDKIPRGYILHHDIVNGQFQLIKKDIHEAFSHYGGHYFNK